jgi:TP901 family phage tail tape measure protein
MANQNFRVGVSVDLTQARRALRRLESEFKEIEFDFGQLGRAERQFRGLASELEKLGRSFNQIDRAITSFDRNLTPASRAISRVASAVRQLERDTRGVRGDIAELGDGFDKLGRGIRNTIRAVEAYDRAFDSLDRNADPFDRIVNSVERLNNAFRSGNIPLDQMAENLGELARAIRLVDRAINALDPRTRKAQFDSLADGVISLRRAFQTTDDDARNLAEEIRDIAQAADAANRAVRQFARSQRTAGVGGGVRQARRSQASPVGFAGIGTGAGFLGIGGVGPQFAISAGVIAGISELGFAIAEATRFTFDFVAASAALSAEFDLLIRRADILAGGGSVGIFSQEALEQGKRTVFTAAEAAEALGELARAGFDSEESVDSLAGVLDLAASDLLALDFAAVTVARSVRSFNLEAEDAGRVADTLANTAAASTASTQDLATALKFVSPVAATLGFNIEEVTAGLGILADRGVNAGIAGRALRFALASLLSPTEKAQRAIDKLGLVLQDENGDFVGFRDIIDQLAAAQGNFGSEAEFAGVLFEAFGKRATNSILLLAQNSDLLRERTAENFAAVGRAAEIADQQLAGLEGAFERLRGELESQQIEAFRLTGLQSEIQAIVTDLDGSLDDIFAAIVDPIFNSIADGVNFIRTDVFEDLVEAAAPVGEDISEIIDSVFAFIVDNKDEIIATTQAIVSGIGGLIDVLLGFGEIGATIFGPLIDGFNSLDSTIQSSLVGAGTGAAIGALFGPAGALVGAGAGALAGAIGDSFSNANIPQQVAEYGVDVGIELTQGLAEGIDLATAIDQAIAAVGEVGTQEASSLQDLIDNRFDASELFADATGQIALFENNLRRLREGEITGITESFEAIGFEGVTQFNASRLLGELQLEAERAGDQLNITNEQIEQVLNRPEVENATNQALARARDILEQIASVDIDPAEIGLDLVEDPLQILANIEAGADLPALTRDGIALSLQEAGDILEAAGAQYSQQAQDTANSIINSLDQFTIDYVNRLETTRDSISAVSGSLGDVFFTGIQDLTTGGNALTNLDLADVLLGELTPEAAAAAANQVSDRLAPTIDSVRNNLVSALQELPEGVLAEVTPVLDALFADESFNLGDQALLGAFIVDQEIQAQAAQDYIDSVQTVFDRIDELTAQIDAPVSPLARQESFLFPDDVDVPDVSALVNQRDALLGLVAAGESGVAALAATSDTALTTIGENAARLESLKGEIEGIAEEIDTDIGIQLSDEDISQAITDLEGLFTEFSSQGVAAADGLESTLSTRLPDALVDPVKAGVDLTTEFLGTRSPSKLYQGIGGDIVDGLALGWSGSFPSLRTTILTDLAQLRQSIEAIFRNINFGTIGGSVNTNPGSTTSGGQPIFHTGGMVPGNTELMARLLGGEFVLQRSAVDQLKNIGVSLHELNRDPRTYFDPIRSRTDIARSVTNSQSTDARAYSTTHNWQIQSGGKVNERRLARQVEKRLARLGKKGL